MTDTTPAEDLALLDHLAHNAMMNWATNGELQPFAMIPVDGPDGEAAMMVVPAPDQGFADQDDKARYVNALRMISIDTGAERAAYAMETWMVADHSDESLALIDEIRARGGSLREHPAVGEALWMIVESDAGATTRVQAIRREGGTVTLGDAEDEFEPMGRGVSIGVFRGFHVPTAIKSTPAAQQFLRQMKALVGIEAIRLDAQDGPSVN